MPISTTVIIASIALGVGANTAIFTILNAIALRPLPVKDAASVVLLTWKTAADVNTPKNALAVTVRTNSPGMSSASSPAFSYPTYLDLLGKAKCFAGVFSYYDGLDRVNLIADGQAEITQGQAVSGNYHSVLQLSPAIGRALNPDDDRESAPPAAMISYRLWRRRFGSDPRIVGKQITLNDVPFTIVGVEQKGFGGLETGSERSVLIPIRLLLRLAPELSSGAVSPFSDDQFWWVRVGARKAPGVSADRARAELNFIVGHHMPKGGGTLSVEAMAGGQVENPLRELFLKPIQALMALVGLVLLIACANIANVLLARGVSRQREMAIRSALGASRWRLVRQSLIESMALSVIGSGIGLLLSRPASRALASFYDWVVELRPDVRVLSFTAIITFLTAILFGLAPAVSTVRSSLSDRLSRTWHSGWLVRLLVVFQLAVSVVILIGSGLYILTLHNLRRLDLGIDPKQLLVFEIEPSLSGYNPQEAAILCRRLLARLKEAPTVRFATASWYIPLSSRGALTTMINVDGMRPARNIKEALRRNVFFNSVAPDYFTSLGTRILVGRGIEERDIANSVNVAVVDEEFARVFFPNQSPIGKNVRAAKKDYLVVGVVRSSKYNDIRRPKSPTLFTAYFQQPENSSLGFELRTTGDAKAIASYVRQAVAEIDPHLPVLNLETEEEVLDRALRQERLFAEVSAGFGVLVLALAATGIYGMRAHLVAMRSKEFGVRMALGASPREIMFSVMRETAWLAVSGIGIGSVVALAVSRFVESMLFGVTSRNLPTFAAAALLLSVVVTLAGVIPALRAGRIQPLIALRHD